MKVKENKTQARQPVGDAGPVVAPQAGNIMRSTLYSTDKPQPDQCLNDATANGAWSASTD